MTRTAQETVAVDGEEVDPTDLTFISLTGDGLVIHHLGWAEEELEGPGGLEPDPIEFGSTQSYTPRNAVEARELLEHHHRQGNPGGQDWFCLAPQEEEMPAPSSGALDEIPDGYAKVDGELVPVEELLGEDEEENESVGAQTSAENGEAPSTSDEDDTGDRFDLVPLTAAGDGEITTKQEAVEALAAEDVDFSGDDAPSPHDNKTDIVEYAHAQGYYFPNYE